MTDKDYALEWDGVLESDGSEITVLPEGDYEFEVKNVTRGSFPGSAKMCACNKVTLTLEIKSEQGDAYVYDDLILHKVMEWKLSQFFLSIGLKKKGEKITMDWSKVLGAKGLAKIGVKEYTDKQDNLRTVNRVEKYIDDDEYFDNNF